MEQLYIKSLAGGFNFTICKLLEQDAVMSYYISNPSVISTFISNISHQVFPKLPRKVS